MTPRKVELLEEVADRALKLVLAQTCRSDDAFAALQNLASALLDLQTCDELTRFDGDGRYAHDDGVYCGND